MLNRYPDLKTRKWTDFVSGHYRQALSTWEALLLKYPNTDVAAAAAQKIARRLLQLGHTYRNLSTSGGSYSDFSAIPFKTSSAQSTSFVRSDWQSSTMKVNDLFNQIQRALGIKDTFGIRGLRE